MISVHNLTYIPSVNPLLVVTIAITNLSRLLQL